MKTLDGFFDKACYWFKFRTRRKLVLFCLCTFSLINDVHLFVFINFQLNKPAELNNAIKSFFELIETNERIRRLYGDAVLDVLSHELILKPRETMKTICSFLGVTCNEDYLHQAENILFGKPSETRRTVVWIEEQKQRVYNEMMKYSFLQSFSFEEE